jgi:hypothetical protein
VKSYEELVRGIVEGQIKSFIHDHPEILDTGTTSWRRPSGSRSKSRERQLLDSIAKRIVLDLTSSSTRTMLFQALQVASGADVD